jgi:hypothetical protein
MGGIMPNLNPLKISRSACLSIISSATEVFPKECMGCVCCNSKNIISIAVPYQIARRNEEEVTSKSPDMFEKMFPSGEYTKFGDYHSHPFQSFEKKIKLKPSPTDLDELKIGSVEIIAETRRARRKGSRWYCAKDGSIRIAWGRFRFKIAAFMRLEGMDKEGIPLYKQIKMNLDKEKKKKNKK